VSPPLLTVSLCDTNIKRMLDCACVTVSAQTVHR